MNSPLWKFKLCDDHTQLPADKKHPPAQNRLCSSLPHLPWGTEALNWCKVTHSAPPVLLDPSGAPSGPGRAGEWPKIHLRLPLWSSLQEDGAASPAQPRSCLRQPEGPRCLFLPVFYGLPKTFRRSFGLHCIDPTNDSHSTDLKNGFSHCLAQRQTVKLLKEEMSGGNKQAANESNLGLQSCPREWKTVAETTGK